MSAICLSLLSPVSAAARTERRFESCTCRRVLDGSRLRSSGRGLGCAPASEREYLDTQLKLDPDFIAVAERLKKRYVLAMLSNDVSEWSAYLRRRFALDRLFTSVVISGDYGFRKPDRRLYQILLRSLSVSPHRCVFVDDQPRNLETAAQLGMHTVCRIRDDRDPLIYELAIETLNDLLTLL